MHCENMVTNTTEKNQLNSTCKVLPVNLHKTHKVFRSLRQCMVAMILVAFAVHDSACVWAVELGGDKETEQHAHVVPRVRNLKCIQLPSPGTTGASERPSIKCEFVVDEFAGEEQVVDEDGGHLEELCDENKLFCMKLSVTRPTQLAYEKISSKVGKASENSNKKADKAPTIRKTELRSSILLQQFYEPPFSQYGPGVESLLYVWSDSEAFYKSALSRGVDDGMVDENVLEDTFLTAQWLHQLGLAHQNEAEFLRQEMAQLMSEENGVEMKEDEALILKQINWSLRAFRQALQYYEGMERSDSTTPNNIDEDPWFTILKQLHMAIAFYNIAEVLAASPDPKQADLDKEYFVQSDQLFSKCKSELMAAPPSMESMNTKFPYIYDEESEERYVDGVPSVKSFWREARLAWGQACLRLGVAEVSSSSSSSTPTIELDLMINDEMNGASMEDLQNIAMNLFQTAGGEHGEIHLKDSEGAEQLQKTLGDLLKNKLPKLLLSSGRAESYFQNAIKLFRKVLADNPGEDDYETELQLGVALLNLGTTSISKGDSKDGIKYLVESLEIHESSLDKSPSYADDTSIGYVDAKQNVGEILYTLSQSYLEQGNYDKAHTYYHRAMEWFRTHDLSPIDIDSASVIDSTRTVSAMEETYAQSIQEFERALEEYQDIFAAGGVGVNSERLDDSGVYYQQDEGYEADLHNGLGTLYMSTGDYMEAMVHITQALQLYSRVGETGERHYADLLFNQALLFFRQGQFLESAHVHYQALELYHRISGDGVNPMLGNGFLDISSLRSLMEEAELKSKQQDGTKDTTETINPKSPGSTTTATKASEGETEVAADGSESLRMNIRPLKLPDQWVNETDSDDILSNVPIVRAQ